MLPWSFGPAEFDVPAGETSVVELRVPARGEINAIKLNQIGGTLSDGSFRIFSSEQAAQSVATAGAGFSSNSASLSGIDPDSYSVVGVKDFADGIFEEYKASYAYRNRDGTPTNGVRRLWLAITPDGIGTLSFSFAMELLLPQPRT